MVGWLQPVGWGDGTRGCNASGVDGRPGRDRARCGATAAAWHWLARRPLPKTKGTIELDGLEGPVQVRRDRWGVPHVEADNAADLWFAEGFCHGQDRLWQMDFYRRVVSRAALGDGRAPRGCRSIG